MRRLPARCRIIQAFRGYKHGAEREVQRWERNYQQLPDQHRHGFRRVGCLLLRREQSVRGCNGLQPMSAAA